MVLNYCNRLNVLAKSIHNWMTCPSVLKVHILNNCGEPISAILADYPIFHVIDENVGNLTSRFRNHNYTGTHMFHVDDDMFYDCNFFIYLAY